MLKRSDNSKRDNATPVDAALVDTALGDAALGDAASTVPSSVLAVGSSDEITDGTGEWSSLDRADAAVDDVSASLADQTRLRLAVPLVTGLVGATALFVFGATSVRTKLERSLQVRAEAALATAGITGAEVEFTGRDATVQIPAGVDAKRVASLIRTSGADPTAPHYSGPRTVSVVVDADRVAPATPTTVAIVPGSITATLTESGTILVKGAVDSEAGIEALRAGVLQQAPSTSVTIEAEVRPGGIDERAATWIGRSIGELSRVGASQGEVSGDGSSLKIRGAVPTLAVRDSMNAFIRTSGLPVDSSLAIVRPVETESESVGPDLFGEDSSATSLQQQAEAILAESNISFRPDSASLTEDGEAVVAQLAELLAGASDSRIQITGHTDSNGSAARNLTLSVARADAVRDELVKKGINASRITTLGEGDTKPLVANDTPANRRTNRRIEVTITRG